MAKPIQIAVSLTRSADEQHGQQTIVVLTDDGRIWEQRDSEESGFVEVRGPWNNKC